MSYLDGISAYVHTIAGGNNSDQMVMVNYVNAILFPNTRLGEMDEKKTNDDQLDTIFTRREKNG